MTATPAAVAVRRPHPSRAAKRPVAPTVGSSSSSNSSNSSKEATDQLPPLPPGHSAWDRLSPEVQAAVVKAAGPLTQFLCGQLGVLGERDQPSSAAVQAIWADAIALDWAGDLHLLPHIELSANDDGSGLMTRVKCRSLFARLCTRFPAQASTGSSDRDLFKAANASNVDFFVSPATFARSLTNIPMRNGWLDLLDFASPIGLGWYAVVYGHADLLRHLVQHHGVRLRRLDTFSYRSAMVWAACGGHLDILRMLHKAGSNDFSDEVMDSAANFGQLSALVWLHEQGFGCSANAMDYAAEHGHMDVVQWLHANRTEGCTYRAIDLAAARGHADIVQWLHEHRDEGYSEFGMNSAVRNGHGGIVEWLRAHPRK